MAVNWKEIDRLAKAQRLIDPSSSEEALLRQLKTWWCIKYSRPFKDPLLNSYSLDELVYEYLCHYYFDPENDPRKEEQAKALKDADDAWVAQQLANMRIEQEQKNKAKAPVPEKAPEPLPEEVPPLPEISTTFE